MAGLFDTLNMGARSLQVQQQCMEVAGHNMANANNPAYARQRVNLATSLTIPTPIGPQGTGAETTGIQQIRDALLDAHITSETSVRGFLEASQQAFQLGQSALGQTIDRQATGAEGTAATDSVGTEYGLAEGLSDLFNAFESLSTYPASESERGNVLAKAQDVAREFRQIDARLASLSDSLNQSVQSDVAKANELLSQIVRYNQEIVRTEASTNATANELRDSRQQRIEELAKLVNIQTVAQSNGSVDISVSGSTLVSGVTLEDQLETYDPGSGQLLVRAQTGGIALALTGGSIQGSIDARDGALATMRGQLNSLAARLITEVNAIHRTGYGLTGTTGEDFFTGSGAVDIGVNQTLVDTPSLLQASGTSGAVGDNQVVLALAQLAEKKHTGLSNQTFSDYYGQTVSGLGQALASANTALSDQDAVDAMLLRQRDAISGVSLDEEMTDLVKFQRAFEASAKLIATIDDMLSTVVNMKR